MLFKTHKYVNFASVKYSSDCIALSNVKYDRLCLSVEVVGQQAMTRHLFIILYYCVYIRSDLVCLFETFVSSGNGLSCAHIVGAASIS